MGSFTGPKIEDTDILFTINAIDKNSYVGSGTSVSDLIGSNDATLTNGVAYDSDGYFELDGSNDYIVLTSVPFTAANGEFTVSFWCRADVYGEHKRIISWGAGGSRFFIGYNNNSSTSNEELAIFYRCFLEVLTEYNNNDHANNNSQNDHLHYNESNNFLEIDHFDSTISPVAVKNLLRIKTRKELLDFETSWNFSGLLLFSFSWSG